jgi:exosortase/archaeosortase family protein
MSTATALPERGVPAHRLPPWRDLALAGGLLAITALIFWPAVRWIATETFAHEQLKQSFWILLLAGAYMAWSSRASLRPVLVLSNTALAWLLTAYVLAAAAAWWKAPLLVLAGLVAAVAGVVEFAFGAQPGRRTRALLVVFGAFLLFVLAFPVLDWPLRRMAGIEAGRLLTELGFASQLAVHPGPPPKLLLFANQRVFEVAAECNGFGLISSSFLLALLLALYRRARWWTILWQVPFCVGLAFVFNLLRIATIVVLTPRFPNHYGLLHETAGIIALYTGLGAVWLVTAWRPAPKPGPPATA